MKARVLVVTGAMLAAGCLLCSGVYAADTWLRAVYAEDFRTCTGSPCATEFYRVDNIGDREYAGSVIVNEGNSRFFESAPRRTHLVGVTLAYAW